MINLVIGFGVGLVVSPFVIYFIAKKVVSIKTYIICKLDPCYCGNCK